VSESYLTQDRTQPINIETSHWVISVCCSKSPWFELRCRGNVCAEVGEQRSAVMRTKLCKWRGTPFYQPNRCRRKTITSIATNPYNRSKRRLLASARSGSARRTLCFTRFNITRLLLALCNTERSVKLKARSRPKFFYRFVWREILSQVGFGEWAVKDTPV